jgi:acyl-CoA synthetase (NDP forming)
VSNCAEKGVKGIVLITAGFREIEDESGGRLQDEVMGIADDAGIPVIGPNTFGIVNLHAGLNASFTPEFSNAKKGGISLVSQSGGMSHLMAFLCMRDDFGFSKIVGLGNRCNIDFADMIPYLMRDRDTRVIAMYMEGIDNPRRLLEVVKVRIRWGFRPSAMRHQNPIRAPLPVDMRYTREHSARPGF